MATKKDNTAVATLPDEQTLALLREQFPSEQGFVRNMLPRLGMVSQDVMEGKGKAMKVVTEAGTFYIEKQTDEEVDILDDNGKKVGSKKKWEREELGDTVEGVIIFQRKQLRYFDEANETYTSSPIYDSDADVIPLFCEKKEIDRGTPKELKAKYEYTDKNGKVKSNLEDNRILYVLYEGEVYQLNLRGTSMYSFMAYTRKILVPAVLTTFSSEANENGAISWNKMMFDKKRDLSAEEVKIVIDHVLDIKQGIAAEKEYFASLNTNEDGTPKATLNDM